MGAEDLPLGELGRQEPLQEDQLPTILSTRAVRDGSRTYIEYDVVDHTGDRHYLGVRAAGFITASDLRDIAAAAAKLSKRTDD